MHIAITERFSTLIENDVFKIAAFLDPFFNITAFEPSKREPILSLIKTLLNAESSNPDAEIFVNMQPATDRTNNYVLYSTEIELEKSSNDSMIEDYIKAARTTELTALDFWRTYEKVFPSLARLAKKYLSIQASSAAVERMFSISGHIFSLKRRRLGYIFFSDLVFLKLNENLINKKNELVKI